jgi:hypothetical protein
VENLSRAPYREFREQLAIPFKDLGSVPEIQVGRCKLEPMKPVLKVSGSLELSA